MNIFTTISSSLVTLFFANTFCFAQTLFWQDNFENAGGPNLGGGTRTPSVNFSFGGPPATRYFFRTTPAGINTTLPALSGFQGSNIWAIEDVDNGSIQSEHQNITWTGINISGRSGLQFRGLFGAGGGTGVWDSAPLVALATDYLIVEYRIDGGPWLNGVRFFPANASVSSTLAQELTGDSLAAGEGVSLTPTFTEYAFSIPGTGTTMDLRMKTHSNSASEEAQIDDFRLYYASALPIEVASIDLNCENDSPSLSWAVDSEELLDRYVIEISDNLTHFKSIGNIFPIQNHAFPKTYHFIPETNEIKSANYIRLSIINQDGNSSVVETISNNCKDRTEQLINDFIVTSDLIVLNLSQKNLYLELVDILGQVVYRHENFDNTVVQIPISKNLSTGILKVVDLKRQCVQYKQIYLKE